MSPNDKTNKNKHEQQASDPLSGSTLFSPTVPPHIPSLPSMPQEPVQQRYPAKQRPPNEFGEIPFDLRYDRQAIYVEVELAPKLAALYDLLPGNKKSIINDVFRRFVEENQELLESRKDLVEKYTHQIKQKKGLE